MRAIRFNHLSISAGAQTGEALRVTLDLGRQTTPIMAG